MSKIILWVASLLLSVSAWAVSPDDNVGVGVILGNPTGFSANYKFHNTRSIDMALAYDLSGDDDRFHIHSTYLFRYPDSLDLESLQLGWYTGFGARALFYNNDNNGNDDDFRLGIRGALGLSLDLEKVPIEIFAELAPVLNIIKDTDLDLDAGIGLRYYF